MGRAALREARSAAGFKELYKAFAREAGHVAPPHWKPVLVMMRQRGLAEGFSLKAKSFDGWTAAQIVVDAAAGEAADPESDGVLLLAAPAVEPPAAEPARDAGS